MSDKVLDERAAAVLAANRYMVLGTTDPDGQPWVTPVYFTPDGHTDFYWASSPAARHSVNLTANPRVSIAVFDSSVPIGKGQAVYLTARAGLVPDDELDRCATLYAARYPELRKYEPDELRGDADLRLYRARATEHWILVTGSDPDYGTGIDSRRPVWT